MPKRPDYPQLVAEAEKAVAAVKDPELKRAAFEKVLDDLLGQGPQRLSKQRPVKAKTSGETPVRNKGKARGPQAYIEEMADDGFFKKPKTIAQVKAELGNRGHHIPLTSLSGPLQKLCQRKILRRQKAKTSGKKQAFVYSNW